VPNAQKSAWKTGKRSVSVTNLDKVFWPEDGLTKGDMLHYYQAVAPAMLPYFKDRPVTLRVYPNGIHDFSHYRRERPARATAWLRTIDYKPETSDETVPLILVDDAAGMLWLANQGSIEMHLWTSRVTDLEHPDQVVFDLDPGDEASFKEVLEVATLLHEILQGLGLQSYAKTSGGRGLHVHLPLAPGHTFEEVRTWAKSIADQLASAHPTLIAVAHGATHAGRQVTFDYAQNSVGRNTAAPYTVRAQPGAPVSAPLSWVEVEEGKVRPSDFTMSVMPQRLKELGDLFKPVLRGKQHIPVTH
jgi:bifunctional non-homologous end joining protein LigD